MPLHWPTQGISDKELDEFMADGYRRSGSFLYRTTCPRCQACEPTRLEVHRFAFTKSLRRVLNRGDQALRMVIQPPTMDPDRLSLLNAHRSQRSLSTSGEPLDADDYRSFLIDTCCDTQEISYWLDSQMVAVAIADFGHDCLSAVYCYFDPQYSRYSLGTYSILKQIQIALETQRRYVYLGMYVAANEHLSYKARFRPQERLIGGQWVWDDEIS